MNILVIRPDALGDSLVTFPILVGLRKKYPGSRITFVGNAGAVPLAKAWAIADEAFEYEEQWAKLTHWRGVRDRFLRELLKRTDLAIGFFDVDYDIVRKNLLRAGVKEVNVPIQKPPENITYPEEIKTHMVEAFAQWVGVEPVKPEAVVLLYTGPEEIGSERPPIVLHPGSGGAANLAERRRWPITSFAALIKRLLALHYPVLLLTGSNRSEAELLKEVQLHLKSSPGPEMLDVLENAPMLEVARRLKQCGCFVGHDTGISHLAGLLGIPTIALFGYTYPNLWRPLGPTVEVIQEKPLSDLPVDRVLESVLRIYNTHRRKGQRVQPS